MKVILATTIATISFVSAAFSEEVCSSISNDLDRLACYDKASGRTQTALPQVKSGGWVKQEDVSKLTDDKSITLYVRSNEVINCGWNNGDKITLYVRCHENKTALIFQTGCHMTSSEYDGYGDIDFRIDDRKAGRVEASASTNNRSLGLWSGSKSIPVIKQMLDGETLVARMTPYGENPFTATFNIAGLGEAVKPLREECEW